MLPDVYEFRSKQQENQQVPDTRSLKNSCQYMLLLLVAQCLRSLTSKKQQIEQMPDKCQSKFDMSDMSCHFTPSSCPTSKKLVEWNQKLVHEACLFKVLLFTAQCIRSLHCTVNNKKMKPYLTQFHWETDILETPFEVTHSCCPMSEKFAQ